MCEREKERERDTPLVSGHTKYRSKLNRVVQSTAVSRQSQEGTGQRSVPQCWDTTGREVRRGREVEPCNKAAQHWKSELNLMVEVRCLPETPS